MDWLTSPEAWMGLLTLTILEIVLGIDNIIFISILAGRLPPEQRAKARRLGLVGAFVSRLMLLAVIAWIVRLERTLFTVAGVDITGKGLILVLGGLFLIAKATHEIHSKLEGAEEAAATRRAVTSMTAVIAQIMVIDVVFSIDSVITAVGMVEQISIMVTANLIALVVMLLGMTAISEFVERHPTVKMLALAFLVLIGTNLVAEGLGHHIPKGYTYFAMAFSVAIEMLNQRLRKVSSKPVQLHGTPRVEEAPGA